MLVTVASKLATQAKICTGDDKSTSYEKQSHLHATARFRLLRITRVYMFLLPTPGLYKAGDITLKNTATA